MDHIDRAGGRFVTILPRSRQEDGQFRKWIQTNTPAWELVWDRPNPRDARGPRDLWYVFKPELPSAELFNIVWVFSTLLRLRHTYTRQRQIATALERLTDLKRRLASARARLRGAAQIDLQCAQILEHCHVVRYIKVKRLVREEHRFKQARRGRPSADMAYLKVTRRRYDIEWTVDEQVIAYDKVSDGMFPTITNDRSLSSAQVLVAYKRQPHIEKRFEQLKTVHEIAPVFLKSEARIEALFTLYFLALMVQALIERELRRSMKSADIAQLPLYPEARACRRPTTEHILRLFSLAERVAVTAAGQVIRVFPPQLTVLQLQVLQLLGVPLSAYRDAS
jgi:transposase